MGYRPRVDEHVRYATAQRVLAVALGLLLAAGMFGGSLLLVANADAAPAGNCRVIAHRALYQGTENQPAGVEAAATWFGAEVDASVTAEGEVIGIHDGKLTRLTGGDLTGFVDEYTYDQVRAPEVSHPFGQFHRTTRLIGAAAATDSPILVTINKWTRIKSAGYAEQTLDLLYAAAQAHPHPKQVFIGGFGAQDAMRARHPDQAVFWRYDHTQSPDEIVANVRAEGVDLVALPKRRHTASMVDRLRALGTITWITTRQITTTEEARTAQAAGIRVLQGDDPETIATRWCR